MTLRNNLTIAFLGLFLCLPAFAKHDRELSSSVLNRFTPSDFKKDSDGSDNSVGNGIKASYVEAQFSKGTRHYVVEYKLLTGACRIVVLRQERMGFVKSSDTDINPERLHGCTTISKYDLNQDGIDEVVIDIRDQVSALSPVFLKWNGQRLVDITPGDAASPEVSALRNVTIFEKPVQKHLVIFDDDYSNDPFAKSRIYKFDRGNLELAGEYDLVSFLGPISGNKDQVINVSFKADATYILKVKNVSDHNRSVRAEVVVNGSVVLKPQDFCKSLPPKKYVGRKDDDDNDDGDEDHCRRCIPVSEAYAIVNMKTANEIKVKVFGRRDSIIQLSAVKK